jgi:hypothetical protein
VYQLHRGSLCNLQSMQRCELRRSIHLGCAAEQQNTALRLTGYQAGV